MGIPVPDETMGSPVADEVEIQLPASTHTIRGLRYRSAADNADGTPDGGRWILLHGWLDNAGSFDRLVPHLFSSGLARDVTALDMSGHGRSDHRGSAYHPVDFAAEVTIVADALYGADARFSLLGHSLGAGVALLAAGGSPSRVTRLVMLEGGGLHHTSSVCPAEQFSRANSKLPSGRLATYPTVADACARRAERNVVPDRHFTIDSARLLAPRGLRLSTTGGYSWSTDPWLMLPTRLYVPKEVQLSFARRVAAPTLVVFTRDGVAAPVLNMRGVSRLGGIGSRGFTLAASAALGIASLSLTALPPVLAFVGLGGAAARLSASLRRAAFGSESAVALSQRIGAIRSRVVVTLEGGGHHPHMAEGGGVADVIAKWARGIASAKGKGQ
jgi:pimeloyl-ACP methyl ester carboxylesterase